MKYIATAITALTLLFLGAYFHENDMARNCKQDGNAAAWFNEIKCEKSE